MNMSDILIHTISDCHKLRQTHLIELEEEDNVLGIIEYGILNNFVRMSVTRLAFAGQ